jgi:hypothetical protein
MAFPAAPLLCCCGVPALTKPMSSSRLTNTPHQNAQGRCAEKSDGHRREQRKSRECPAGLLELRSLIVLVDEFRHVIRELAVVVHPEQSLCDSDGMDAAVVPLVRLHRGVQPVALPALCRVLQPELCRRRGLRVACRLVAVLDRAELECAPRVANGVLEDVAEGARECLAWVPRVARGAGGKDAKAGIVGELRRLPDGLRRAADDDEPGDQQRDGRREPAERLDGPAFDQAVPHAPQTRERDRQQEPRLAEDLSVKPRERAADRRHRLAREVERERPLQKEQDCLDEVQQCHPEACADALQSTHERLAGVGQGEADAHVDAVGAERVRLRR